MKKQLFKQRFWVIITAAVILAISSGIYFDQVRIKDKNDLVIIECSSVYPEFTLTELSHKAENIFYARVTGIGVTIMQPVYVSLSEDPTNGTDNILYEPITPVYLSIIDSIKGESTGEYTYYEDGGITDTYIMKPSGYEMSKDMEVVLLLNDKGFGWGKQSIYPVIDNNVIVNSSSHDELIASNISITNVSMSSEKIASQLSTPSSVETCELDSFINLLKSFNE